MECVQHAQSQFTDDIAQKYSDTLNSQCLRRWPREVTLNIYIFGGVGLLQFRMFTSRSTKDLSWCSSNWGAILRPSVSLSRRNSFDGISARLQHFLDKSNESERELRPGARSEGEISCFLLKEERRASPIGRSSTLEGLTAAWALTCGFSRPKSSLIALLKSCVLTQ